MSLGIYTLQAGPRKQSSAQQQGKLQAPGSRQQGGPARDRRGKMPTVAGGGQRLVRGGHGGAHVLRRFQIHQQERTAGQVAGVQEIKGTMKTQANPASGGPEPAWGDRHMPPPPSLLRLLSSGALQLQATAKGPEHRKKSRRHPHRAVTAAAT